jgi:formylglycine-generating enzyme required for sulfatase activity
LLRHGRYILPCCFITALFLSACAEQKSEAKKKQIELATANDMPNQAGREIIGKDGLKMLLIPAGDFMMGSTEGLADEEPVHHVSLDAFYLDKYEVTNKLFQKFVRETGYETTAEKEDRAAGVTSGGEWEVIPGANWRKPEGGETVFESNREEHPVVSVSWYDLDDYCRWACAQRTGATANRGTDTTTSGTAVRRLREPPRQETKGSPYTVMVRNQLFP